MLPGGLRTRLVLAFVAIIVLSLAVAGAGVVSVLQGYETQQALNRLESLASPAATLVRWMELQGLSQGEIASFLDGQARDRDVRILLVSEATRTIVYDTGGTLVDHILEYEGVPPGGAGSTIPGTVEPPGEGRLVVVSANPSPVQLAPRLLASRPQYYVVLAQPEGTLASGLLSIAPQLAIAGLIALIASVGAAFVIARSISRPLAAIARASDAMARGDYDQRTDIRGGGDEVAQLAAGFNRMAQEVAKSQRTLRDFLADVSHELRTPLTTIHGFAQAILEGLASGRQPVAEAARIINQDAARMQRMVEDLLYLSQIESGQLKMELQPMRLSAIVEGAVKRASGRAGCRPVYLECRDLPDYVLADPHRIQQVMDNVLSNAIAHSPADGEIRVHAAAEAGTARIRVHNTGSHIRTEDRDRIFERFYRAGGGSGTGLGLSIASEIVRSHRGRIELESSPGDGTAFTIVLPLAPIPHAGP
ncbi:MAG: HAMP domain-containing protein [Chloroflexi bacterium]|nr:HAMP domain-containing protein [Chloroflexota bacterium]